MPSASVMGSAPRQVRSSMQPRLSLAGPLMVPLANRSPGRMLQPVDVWCASIWLMVQYMSAKVPMLTRVGAMPFSRMAALAMSTSSFTSTTKSSDHRR